MARTIVKLLQIRTAVFVAPNLIIQQMAPDFESLEVQQTINDVGGEHAAEEKNFGHQKQPHAEAAGLALLLDSFKLMSETRRMRRVRRVVAAVSDMSRLCVPGVVVSFFVHNRNRLRNSQ